MGLALLINYIEPDYEDTLGSSVGSFDVTTLKKLWVNFHKIS